MSRSLSLAVALVVSLGAAGCFSKRTKVRIAWQERPDAMLSGEILAAHLEKTLGAASVERRPALGDSTLLHQTMLSGEIDVYPEYSGVLFANILKLPVETVMDLTYGGTRPA
mgnify:CR=1 FL=1